MTQQTEVEPPERIWIVYDPDDSALDLEWTQIRVDGDIEYVRADLTRTGSDLGAVTPSLSIVEELTSGEMTLEKAQHIAHRLRRAADSPTPSQSEEDLHNEMEREAMRVTIDELTRERDALREAAKKALTCATLNSDVRALIVAALATPRLSSGEPSQTTHGDPALTPEGPA